MSFTEEKAWLQVKENSTKKKKSMIDLDYDTEILAQGCHLAQKSTDMVTNQEGDEDLCKTANKVKMSQSKL